MNDPSDKGGDLSMLTKTQKLRTLALVFLISSSTTLAQLPALDTERPSLAPILKEVTPAVVNISVTGRNPMRLNPLFNDPFFRRFFEIPEGGQLPPQQSAGSGVIIDAGEGYVLTNHHVVANAEEIVVTLADRRTFDAELIGSDEGTDIALLKIDATGLTAIEIGDSDSLEVGDFVIAIGNPFGLGQTVTSGIVSALGRSGLQIEGGRYQDFIQTDASINPGNSGGALVDLDGALVGINSAIITPGGGNVGIGFAVPSNLARDVTAQLLEYGEVRRGRLGIGIQDVTPDLAEALGLSIDRGAVITQVEPNSSAEAAGLRAGDVITEFNGTAIENGSDLANKVGLVRVGSDVEIAFLRDGQRREVTATIGEAPDSARAAAGGPGTTIERLDGAQFRNLDSSHPQYGRVQGALVASVEPGSPAARNGLQQGDIVTAVNRQNVSSVDELTAALEAAGPTVALNILRDEARLYIVIR
jgi:Do/DeqQ family serine protease